MKKDRFEKDNIDTEELETLERNNGGAMNQKKRPDLWTYVNIILLALIIMVGMNRFVFARGFNLSRSGGENLSKIGLEYYMENYGKETGGEGITSVVRNYGCHQEIHIYQNGKLLMRLSYFNGEIYEL